MLGIIEGQIATILRHISTSHVLPSALSEEWQALLMFIALQAGRTRISGDASDAMADYFAKMMAQGRAEFDGIDLDKFKIGNTYPAALPMQVSIQGYGFLNSLGRALLINNSNVPFLCSDNPVVFYNSQRSHLQDEGVIGLDSIGLQIFYPLDSQRAIYLYDESVYSRPTNTGVRKTRLKDIIKINLIHYMWSDRNVYCSGPEYEGLLRDLSAASADYIPFERVCFRESDRVANDDGTESSLMHNFRAQSPIEANFTFADHLKHVSELDTGIRSRRHRAANDLGESGTSYRFSIGPDRRAHLKGAALTKAVSSIERRVA